MFSASTYYSGWKSDERYNLWKSHFCLKCWCINCHETYNQIFKYFSILEHYKYCRHYWPGVWLEKFLIRSVKDEIYFETKSVLVLQFKDVFISKIVLSYYLVLFEFSTVEVTGPLNLKIVSKFFQIILQEGVKYKARNEEVTNWFWRGKVSSIT